MTDFEYCKRINKKYGKGYYFATKFFPKKVRLGTYALYAWTRIPDDIVDIEKNEEKLDEWIKVWRKAEEIGKSDRPEMNAMLKTRKDFSIPKEYNDAFIESMKMDFYKNDYKNMEELKKYMYGSATSVGLMMMHVFGNFKKEAVTYATDLAEAMQLTNFLRDVKEDIDTKERVYLPKDEMDKFNVTKEDIKNENLPKEFVIFKIKQARELFERSRLGIKMLPKRARFPILLSSYIYEAILDKIERQNFDVFVRRAHTNFFEKIIILFKTIWKIKNI